MDKLDIVKNFKNNPVAGLNLYFSWIPFPLIFPGSDIDFNHSTAGLHWPHALRPVKLLINNAAYNQKNSEK